MKLMLPLTKKSRIFWENTQKLDSICKSLFQKIQYFWFTESQKKVQQNNEMQSPTQGSYGLK